MISAKDLTFRYPGAKQDTLRNFDLELPKGHFGFLEAAGGRGKSTFTNLLIGVHLPTAGALEVNGIEVSSPKVTSALRRSVGLVTQDIGLITDRSVAENISLPLELNGGRAEDSRLRLFEVLHRFGLTDLKNEYPPMLSEGERRRVMLARALVKEPLLLVLDEPTHALDQKTATALWDLLFREHQRGMTILAAVSDLPVDPRFKYCLRFSIPTLEQANIPETGQAG